MLPVRDTDRAYIAGLFDGEGSIQSKLSRWGAPVVFVSVAQKDDCVLHWVKEITEVGTVLRDKRISYWRVYNRTDVSDFISLILPFAIVKREQLELGAVLCGLQGKPGFRLDPEKLGERLSLHLQLGELKRHVT